MLHAKGLTKAERYPLGGPVPNLSPHRAIVSNEWRTSTIVLGAASVQYFVSCVKQEFFPSAISAPIPPPSPRSRSAKAGAFATWLLRVQDPEFVPLLPESRESV
jgi:hypothetical protein